MNKTYRSSFNTRQYMLAKDYEVFYYSDMNFKTVGNHVHDYFEFYIFLEGSVEMVIEDQKVRLSAGDLIVVPPGTHHHLNVIDGSVPYRHFVLWISIDYVKHLWTEAKEYVYLIGKAVQQKEYFFHLSTLEFNEAQVKAFHLLEKVHGSQFGRDAAVKLAVNDLLLFLSQSIYEKTNPEISPSNPDLFQSIILYINTKLDEPLDLDSIADQFFVSKFYIAHLFKKTIGITVHQYITKKRLEACTNELLNGSPATLIYSRYGFDDYSGFYRAFMKEYGLSPKDYQSVYLHDPERFQKADQE